MITIETSSNGQVVEIILDGAGIDELRSQLDTAERQGDAHMSTPQWAGNALSGERQSIGTDAVVVQSCTIRVFKD